MARGAGEQSASPAVARGRLVQTEHRRADQALALFDEARAIAGQAEGAGDQELVNQIDDHAWTIVREADPVRLSYAKEILGLSDQTVREWLDAELLEDFGGSPRRVGLESLVRVRDLIADVRASGQQRDLMRAVLRRLELEELEADSRFMTSVRQMRRGERG